MSNVIQNPYDNIGGACRYCGGGVDVQDIGLDGWGSCYWCRLRRQDDKTDSIMSTVIGNIVCAIGWALIAATFLILFNVFN